MNNIFQNPMKAKLALFAVLGLLAAANFHGHQSKKQGELEFASIKQESVVPQSPSEITTDQRTEAVKAKNKKTEKVSTKLLQ